MSLLYRDLRSFLQALQKEKVLVEIHAPVDPHLELAEIHRRVIEQNGPALLFTQVKGGRYPVVTNLFGTKKRVDLAFGQNGPALVQQAVELVWELFPPSYSALWEKRNLLKQFFSLGSDSIKNAPVLEVHESPPMLSQLPLLTTWEQDGGPFITLPLVYTEHPETGISNLGIYRMQRYDDQTTGMHMQIGKGGGFHLARAKELGKKLPVNVFVGGAPATILAAIAPLPENIPEILLASFVLGEKLRVTKNPAGSLPLFADAEFALTGFVDPLETLPEGPFGDHYGYYSLKHDFPVFRCQSVFHRKDAIYPATVVGKPRQEDFFIGDYLQELLAPIFPIVMPTIKNIWSYGETGFHSLAAAVITERYKREAMVSAFRILGEGQLSLTKFLLLVDQALDLKDFRSVFEHVLERADFRSDLYVFSHTSMDTLDYTGPRLNEGSKGVLLGIGNPIRSLPAEFHETPPNDIDAVFVFCRGCLVISGPSYTADKDAPQRLANHPAFSKWPIIVLCDNAEFTAKESSSFLWSTFTRFEPASDIYAKQVSLRALHPSFESPIVIDSRMKPNYPEELFCDPNTKKLVDDRWSEYFKS